MPRQRIKVQPLVCLLLTGTIIMHAGPLLAEDLLLRGEIIGRDGKKAESRSLLQRYSADYAKLFTLTELMSLQGSIRYTDTIDDGVTQQQISPTLRFDLVNNYFQFDSTGTLTKNIREDQSNTTIGSWQANMNSLWHQRFAPSLRLHAGQNSYKDNLDPHTQDTENSQAGASMDWDLSEAQLFLSYNHDETKDFANLRRTQNDEYYGKIETERHYLADRIRLNLAQQVDHNRQENKAPVTAAGEVLIPTLPSSALFIEDSSPNNTGPMTPVAGLLDGDTTTVALTLDPLQPLANIAFRIDSTPVRLIYLYSEIDLGANAGLFTWDVYESNDGTNWTRVVPNASFIYDNTERRFEIQTGLREDVYVKVVATAMPAVNVALTEAELWDITTGTGTEVTIENNTTTAITSAEIFIALRPDLQLTNNLRYQRDDISNAPDMERKSASADLRWQARENLSADFTAGVNTQEREGEPETSTRIYGVDSLYTPLSTLELLGGLTLRESYDGSERTLTSTNYRLNTTAQLYKDLQAQLNLNETDSKNESEQTTTRYHNANLTLTARLFPTLFGELRTEYQGTNADQQDDYEIFLLLNWRPSDIFGARMSVDQQT